MRVILLLLCTGTILAIPGVRDKRIFGGSVTTIDNYPEIVALLSSTNLVDFRQECGGSILNQIHILTAAHCCNNAEDVPERRRVRVGSSLAHSGGVIHNVAQIFISPLYDYLTLDADVAILRLSNFITYSNGAQPAFIAGPNYNVADNQEVWAAGWGFTELGGPSEQLRHVQVWTINQAICSQRYGAGAITDNMLCSGWLDVGIRDQCGGDSGGPLYHNGIVVGVCSWGYSCASPIYPGVNARVSQFASWIQSIAN